MLKKRIIKNHKNYNKTPVNLKYYTVSPFFRLTHCVILKQQLFALQSFSWIAIPYFTQLFFRYKITLGELGPE